MPAPCDKPELLDRVAEGLEIGTRQRRVVAIALADALPLFGERDQLLRRRDGVFREPQLQRRFDGEEIGLRHQRGHRLPRILSVRND